MSEPENQTPDTTPVYGAAHPQDQPIVEEPTRLGPFARLAGTLLSPGETFADVNRKPTWLAPMIIAIITTVAFSFFYDWKVKPDYLAMTRKQMAQRAGSGEMPPENQIQQAANISSKINWVIALISPIVGLLFVSGVFALGMLLMQAQTTFKKILSVVAWSSCAVGLVSTVVVAASVMIRDDDALKTVPFYAASKYCATNLKAALSADVSPVIKAIAGSVDIFSIWTLILLAFGFAAIAGSRKLTIRKTGALVIMVWLIGVLISVGFAAMGFGGG